MPSVQRTTNTLQNEEGYLPLPPQLLLPSTAADFPVYIKQGGRYVLYAKSGDSFLAGHRERLDENGHTAAYIPQDCYANYVGYLQQNIVSILEDETISPAQRAATWSETLCDLAASFLGENMPKELVAKHLDELETTLLNTARFFEDPNALKTMARFISQGNDAYRHGVGVMVYTFCILQSYGADNLLKTAAGLGALLHDVGRLRLPKDVLDTPPEEHDERQRTLYVAHPSIGVQMCGGIPLISETLECILHHHERMDGTGFPSRAMSEHLPLHVRAVVLANAYDTLTRDHPWRKALTPFKALKEIRQDEGARDDEMFKRLVTILARADLTNWM